MRFNTSIASIFTSHPQGMILYFYVYMADVFVIVEWLHTSKDPHAILGGDLF